jgi:triacylglycerol esterase/lipase EstA (alpha/beta hydrolase family)
MASKKLFLVVPGLRGSRKKWQPLLARLQADPALSDSQQVTWKFCPHGFRPWSFGSALNAGRNLRSKITGIDTNEGPFDEIVLVGHSLGAILIRDAYLREAKAYEVNHNGHYPAPEPGNWAERVRRIILFASVCRGFNPEATLFLRLSVAVSRLCGFYGFMLASDLQQGAGVRLTSPTFA